MPGRLARVHTINRPLEARSYTKEFNRKPERPSVWRKIKWFRFAISAKAIILVPRKHTKILAKLSIYKIYYNVTDFLGLHTIRRLLEARSNTKEFNRKPGRPSFRRKIKWFSFRNVRKGHGFDEKETSGNLREIEFLQNLFEEITSVTLDSRVFTH